MSSDPTDNALATIASILEPERRDSEKTAGAEHKPSGPPQLPSSPAPTPPPAPIEAHGYTKHGPGPMAAIRFKWSVRLDNGNYYVDETIGENSAPVVSGPMSREDAVAMVDDRETNARRRFEQLKSEMGGGT